MITIMILIYDITCNCNNNNTSPLPSNLPSCRWINTFAIIVVIITIITVVIIITKTVEGSNSCMKSAGVGNTGAS